MTTEWNKMVAILRHSLGIQWAHDKEYRDYYCACVGEDRLERMADKCLMKRGNFINGGRDRYYFVTELGRAVAREDIPRKTRSQLRYERFLSVCDCCPDLTFKEFITDPQYREVRP